MAKKAVLVGCNYPGTDFELRGCFNDVMEMCRCLMDRYGFAEEDITILSDTDDSYVQPTGANIRNVIDQLVSNAETGDILYFHYSGHGTRLPAETDDEDDTGYDECIVPCDNNYITDDDIREFVDKVPAGCRITIVSDSCHSGGLIEQCKEQIGESTITDGCADEDGESSSREIEDDAGYGGVRSRSLPLSRLIDILKQKSGRDDIVVGNLRSTLFNVLGEDASSKVKKFMNVFRNKFQEGGEGDAEGGDEGYAEPAVRVEEVYAGSTNKGLPERSILISGCQTYQTSADIREHSGNAYGALSNAILRVLDEANGSVTNRELVEKVREMLSQEGYTQRPGLYCSDDHADAPFVC